MLQGILQGWEEIKRQNELSACKKKQKTKMNKIMSAEQTMVVVGSGPVIVLHICIASLSIN